MGGVAVSEGANAGRGFFVAYDITQTPPKLLWRSFLIPPQDGSDPAWSIHSVDNMSNAWIFNGTGAVDLKQLQSSNPSLFNQTLYGDWGNFGFNGTNSFAGGATGWAGSDALDTITGIAYVGTAQTSPDFNASTRPGPNLWTNSILAINITNGKFIWGFKAVPHDMWDYDCSWNVILHNATINGVTQPTVFKGCKNGYVYALSAKTGQLLWYFKGSSMIQTQWTIPLNPLNKSDMTKPWPNYPSKGSYLMEPGPV